MPQPTGHEKSARRLRDFRLASEPPSADNFTELLKERREASLMGAELLKRVDESLQGKYFHLYQGGDMASVFSRVTFSAKEVWETVCERYRLDDEGSWDTNALISCLVA